MKYLSTRDDSLSRSFNDILYQGLSRDGGLYLPQSWPKIDLLSLKNKSYEEVACEIIFPECFASTASTLEDKDSWPFDIA